MRKTFALLVVLFVAVGAQAQWTVNGSNIYFLGGKVGIGVTTPDHDLKVESTTDAGIGVRTQDTTKFAFIRLLIPANSTVNNTAAGFYFQEGLGDFTTGNRFFTFGLNPVLDAFQILGGNANIPRLVLKANGNIGIGTVNPTTLLDVSGNINAAGNVTVSGNIAAKYQDVAEWVPANEPLAPATVVVLNSQKSNEVMPSAHAYDTAVAGVVSSKPGLILGERGDNKEQIATSGRVKVRVDATKAPILVGDLLVTSDRAGLAMKSIPVDLGGVKMHRPGTIIGKALEPLQKGEGEILVLLTLQ
jgi:hypothetical protein